MNRNQFATLIGVILGGYIMIILYLAMILTALQG